MLYSNENLTIHSMSYFKIMFFATLLVSSLVHGSFGNTPYFIANNGQLLDQNDKKNKAVSLYLNDGMNKVLFQKDKISYQFGKEINEKEIEVNRIDVFLEGANGVVPIGEQIKETSFNFYNVAENPILSVPTYSAIKYPNVYDGIDLIYYLDESGQLKYDFLVAPNADISQIKMRIAGGTVSILDNQLILKSELGIVRESALKVFQEDKVIPAYWQIEAELISVNVPDYDSNKSLVIDPPVQLWGTYLGVGGINIGHQGAVDSEGNVLACGETSNFQLIATSGAHQSTYGGGNSDAFLIKFDATGNIIWGTFYGGAGTDRGFSCNCDAADNSYLVGTTGSPTNISTSGVHSTAINSSLDGFLVKFDVNGIREWGTYFGGESEDWVDDVQISTSQKIAISGRTQSANNIASTGAHQTTYAGNSDGFIAVFNSNGTLDWATYYGGPSYDHVWGVGFNTAGDVFFTGQTQSSSQIATPNSHKPNYTGNGNAFLGRMNANGVRQWATYFGGNNQTFGKTINVLTNGNVAIAGETSATNGIAFGNVYQNTNAGASDGYIAYFQPSGTLNWATYFGGPSLDMVNDITSDTNNFIYIAGETWSQSGIASLGSHQETFGGGADDAFIASFDLSGNRLWSSYFGGENQDKGSGITAKGNQDIYLIGRTNSIANIATTGTQQSTNTNGVLCLFVAKFDGEQNVSGCDTTFATVNWDVCDQVTSPSGAQTWTQSGIYMDTISNVQGCDSIITVNLTVTNIDLAISLVDDTMLVLSQANANYSWIDCNDWSVIPNETGSIFTPNSNGAFAAIIDYQNCIDTTQCIAIQVLSNSDFILDEWRVFPNPSNGVIWISSKQGGNFKVFDSLGKEVGTWAIKPGIDEFILENASGIYFIANPVDGSRKKVIVTK